MKFKPIAVFVLFFFCNNARAQIILPQLSAGQQVDTLIYTFIYNFTGSCIPQHEFAFEIDTNFIPVASGTNLYGIISGLSSPNDSVLTTEKGYLQNGDTIFFDITSPVYTFFSPYAGVINVDLYLSGTPNVSFEPYPCELFMMCTLGTCSNTCLLTAISNQCIVNDPNDIVDPLPVKDVTPYPNPVIDILNFDNISDEFYFSDFVLYDSSRKIAIIKQLIPSNTFSVKLNNLKPGVYFYKFIKDGTTLYSGKVYVGVL